MAKGQAESAPVKNMASRGSVPRLATFFGIQKQHTAAKLKSSWKEFLETTTHHQNQQPSKIHANSLAGYFSPFQ